MCSSTREIVSWVRSALSSAPTPLARKNARNPRPSDSYASSRIVEGEQSVLRVLSLATGGPSKRGQFCSDLDPRDKRNGGCSCSRFDLGVRPVPPIRMCRQTEAKDLNEGWIERYPATGESANRRPATAASPGRLRS